MYHPAAVGEDSILPGGGTRYDGKRWANAYRHRTFSHSTEHAKSIRWREADSLPYNGLYDFWVQSNICHATVGEDSILPRGICPQKAIALGELVSTSYVFPFNQTREIHQVAGG